MPEGGTLKVEAMLERERLAHGKCADYVTISVHDTGSGMDPVTLKRAVEPFYTTKPAGHGTGLGLSMVHGLAAQSGGDLALTSVLGQGTTAILRLPVSHEAVETQAIDANDVTDVHQAVIILIVDDEDLVRSSTGSMLEDIGCTIIEANSGVEALEHIQANPRIGAVVTDYAMPGMTGVQLAREIRKIRKGLPVLMITGFAART